MQNPMNFVRGQYYRLRQETNTQKFTVRELYNKLLKLMYKMVLYANESQQPSEQTQLYRFETALMVI